MKKPAPVHHPIHEMIQHRWSPRAFSSQPVPPDVLRSLFEAARWAASSNNEQPWAFLVTTADDKENHEKMVSTLVIQPGLGQARPRAGDRRLRNGLR